jgi:hypothetical protein
MPPFPLLKSAPLAGYAALVVFAGCILLSNAHAQINANARSSPAEPDSAVSVFQNPISSDQLTFLNDYAHRQPKEVMKDKRYRSVMKVVLPRTEYHYGSDMPLSEAIRTLLDGPPLPVDVRDGRYVMVASHGGPYLKGRGFMWFDMQEGIALGGIFFQPVNGEPSPTLTIFSRQLRDNFLATSQLPAAFVQDLNQWAGSVGIPPLTTRYFINESGKKFVLVHDEDYCGRPVNAPAPTQDPCEQMNAYSADIDMNAAYFMAQTHNAANATAWHLSPDLSAWTRMRNDSCLAGPGGVACRIRLTRERTRVLLGRSPR